MSLLCPPSFAHSFTQSVHICRFFFSYSIKVAAQTEYQKFPVPIYQDVIVLLSSIWVRVFIARHSHDIHIISTGVIKRTLNNQSTKWRALLHTNKWHIQNLTVALSTSEDLLRRCCFAFHFTFFLVVFFFATGELYTLNVTIDNVILISVYKPSEALWNCVFEMAFSVRKAVKSDMPAVLGLIQVGLKYKVYSIPLRKH